MNKSDPSLILPEMMMTKNRRRQLVTEQDVEAALQLIQLKDYHRNIISIDSGQHLRSEIHEPFMNTVLKSKEFLQAQDKNNDDNNINISTGVYEKIRKKKRKGVASCSSSITFDLDDNSDEDVNEAVGCLKKMKKFRSIADIYNVTKPL